jgi:hypothetical protein
MSRFVFVLFRISKPQAWIQKYPRKMSGSGLFPITIVPGTPWNFYTWTLFLSILSGESQALLVVSAAKMRKEKEPNPFLQAICQMTPEAGHPDHRDRAVSSDSPTRASISKQRAGIKLLLSIPRHLHPNWPWLSIDDTCCSDDPYVTMVLPGFRSRRIYRDGARCRSNSVSAKYVPST